MHFDRIIDTLLLCLNINALGFVAWYIAYIKPIKTSMTQIQIGTSNKKQNKKHNICKMFSQGIHSNQHNNA